MHRSNEGNEFNFPGRTHRSGGLALSGKFPFEEKLEQTISSARQVLPVDKIEGLIECVEDTHSFLESKSDDQKANSKSGESLKEFIDASAER